MGSSNLYQWLVIICANINTITYGTGVAWTSSAFLVLESDDSPLPSGPLTMSELSWIGSTVGIGGITGTCFMGWLSERYGRKPVLFYCGIPALIGWILVIFAQNAWYLIVARFLFGFTGSASYAVIPLMVPEIAENNIRGALGSVLTLASNMGILISFIIGHYFSYQTVPFISLIFPIAFLITFAFFPESPYYLVKQNKLEEAKKSLQFYRNIDANSTDKKSLDLIDGELSSLKLVHRKPSDEIEKAENARKWSDFVSQPVIIGIAIMVIHDTCGIFTMISYTGKIFAQSGADVDPNQAAIIVGFIQLLGTYISTLLVDRAGRKILFTVSCLGTGLSHIVLATYIYLSSNGYDLENLELIPIISFSAVLFIASMGMLPLPYVILGEIIPDKLRSTVTPFCLNVSWFQSFLFLQIFPSIVNALGLHGCIYIFAGSCFVGAIYIMLCIPETKGRSLADIENSFMKKKKTPTNS